MVTVQKADVEDMKQRRIMFALLMVAIVGFALVGFDYYRKTSVTILPEETTRMEDVILRLKVDGFVRSFDVKTGEIVVDPVRWANKKRAEKMSLIVQLARYCAERNKTAAYELRVKSQTSGELLAEMGNRGLNIL